MGTFQGFCRKEAGIYPPTGAKVNKSGFAGVFCVMGSSKGSPVLADMSIALLLPAPQNPSGAALPNLL